MTSKAISRCRAGVLLLALLYFLISAGFVFAHPEKELSFFFSLGGLLMVLLMASPYIGLAVLVKLQSSPSAAHCVVLILGALGVGFISLLGWALAIDTWPTVMALFSQILFKMSQWLVVVSTGLLLIGASLIKNFLKTRYS